MKLVANNCPKCQAPLGENAHFCAHCGTQIMVDDEALHHKFTYQQVDNARIHEADVKEKIRLKELEIEQIKLEHELQQKRFVQKTKLIFFLVLIFLLAMLIILYKITDDDNYLSFSFLVLIATCIITPFILKSKNKD